MNKRTKISLVLVISVILVILSVGLVSAKSAVNSSTCWLNWRVIDNHGVHSWGAVIGTAVWSVEENTITKTCAGNIPLGESPYRLYYYDLDEMRAYLEAEYGADIGNPYVMGPEDTGYAEMVITYKNHEITSDDWIVRVNPNGDFEYTAYFDIE